MPIYGECERPLRKPLGIKKTILCDKNIAKEYGNHLVYEIEEGTTVVVPQIRLGFRTLIIQENNPSPDTIETVGLVALSMLKLYDIEQLIIEKPSSYEPVEFVEEVKRMRGFGRIADYLEKNYWSKSL